ncbi:unnamed protein product [Pylaiella littoralis]
MLGDGTCLSVAFFGDVDLLFRWDEDILVTLANVAVVPGFVVDLKYFNLIQENAEIILNQKGASMLGGNVQFIKYESGYSIPKYPGSARCLLCTTAPPGGFPPAESTTSCVPKGGSFPRDFGIINDFR